MSKEDFLLESLRREVQRFDQESKAHKKLHRNLRYAVFCMTATSTALAALSIAFPHEQKRLSLLIIAITSIAGLLTSVEGLRKPSELWIHERTIYFALQDLLRELEFGCAVSCPPELIDEIFKRMQSILGAAGEKWNREIVSQRAAVQGTAVQSDGPLAHLPHSANILKPES